MGASESEEINLVALVKTPELLDALELFFKRGLMQEVFEFLTKE